MAAPVAVVLDRGGLNSLDLSPFIRGGSLRWSSVIPGGFASCTFALDGDFRQLLRQVPFLSTVRVIGDSGRVLFEGQVEDLAPHLTESSVGITVSAFGFQNVLKETSVRAIWSKRDLTGWIDRSYLVADPNAWTYSQGPFADDLTKSGISYTGGNSPATLGSAHNSLWVPPSGVSLVQLNCDTGVAGGANLQYQAYSYSSGAFTLDATGTTSGTLSQALSRPGGIALGIDPTVNFTPTTAFRVTFSNIRVLGTSVAEDVAGGFYGGTLINSLLSSYVPELGVGVIEAGSDFTIDHLDASVRRSAYDVLQEIAGYYAREWAVWEDALLDWTTPQLSQPQWIIPIGQLSALDLDASVQNSKRTSVVLYTDAAFGRPAEQSASSTDRRNPYVLNGRAKDELDSQSFPMTSATASQLASVILRDLGFGPVPAAGTISLNGDTIVQHAQGNAVKAWEIRAGDNITIPELPLADVFTQDGRGEVLFHVVSTEADAQAGTMTFTLDSYGSKRSDVLLARLAAVTSQLGG
jgi:hypothetical protein